MFKFRGKGRTRGHKKGMNRLEKEYQSLLEARRIEGEIEWVGFECIKFRLADKTYLTPDFMVMRANGEIEVHEVKGFMEEDANVKLKVCAENFPFKFFLAKKLKGQWDVREVSSGA